MCKHSEIYPMYNFQKYCHGSKVKNIDLARKDMSNKLMIFRSNWKKGETSPFGGKRSYPKWIRGYTTILFNSVNSVISTKINSGRAVDENIAQAISAHTDLY